MTTPIPYAHVAQAVFLRPWAIRREVHDQIRAIVRVHIEQGHLSAEEVQERMAAARQRTPAAQPVGVAVIPVHGVIMPRASIMAEMSGGTSVERLRSNFRSAMADGEVDGVVFDVDSPGGLVDGIPELAAEIRAARGQKPMTAVANTMMASAAYWLGAQADELVVTPSGEAGSIGVFSAHEDWSAWWDDQGIKTTLISAGKYKTEGNEYEPLSEEAQAYFQSQVDDYYGMFTRDVGAARGVTAKAVREGYGQGRMMTAKRAVDEGLVDRVGTLEDAIGRVAAAGAKARRDREAALAAASSSGTYTIAPVMPTAWWAQGEAQGLVELPAPEPPPPDPAPEPPAPEPTPDPAPTEPVGAEAEFYQRRARIRDRDHRP